MELKDKRVLITGAANRLGRAMALTLAQAGAKLILHYNQSGKEMKKCVDLICSSSALSARDVSVVQADLNKSGKADYIFDRASVAFGGVDILINNASVYPLQEGNLTKSDREENNTVSINSAIERIYTINTRIPFLLSQRLALSPLEDDGLNRMVINMLDARIGDHCDSDSIYLASKRELSLQTQELALELAPSVRVNGIAPGLILYPSGMIDAPEDYLEKRRKFNPLEITPSVVNITEAMLFLLRNDAVTGQIIFVDGGRHLKEFTRGV